MSLAKYLFQMRKGIGRSYEEEKSVIIKKAFEWDSYQLRALVLVKPFCRYPPWYWVLESSTHQEIYVDTEGFRS